LNLPPSGLGGLLVFFDDVCAFYHHTPALDLHADNFTAQAFVFSGDDFYRVTCF
jgi:hypothetical protein